MVPPLQALFLEKREVHRPVDDPNALVLEAWSEGLMTGSLVIMAAITIANMRAGVLLHKLILLEVLCRVPIAVHQWCLYEKNSPIAVDPGHGSRNLHFCPKRTVGIWHRQQLD